MSTKTEFGFTVQDLQTAGSTSDVTSLRGEILSNAFILSVHASLMDAPQYWSTQRDNWMVDFVKQPGNDLLAGAQSTLISKVASTNFYVEGPLSLAIAQMRMLNDDIGFGEGWTPQISKWTQSYLNRDAGGGMENLRASATDHSGPSLGFAHIDESLCLPTKSKEWPIIYHNPKKGPIKMHRSQISWMLDTSESRDKWTGVGFCSVSRSLATAMILMDIVRYKRERLSDLPPAAIMLLNNLTDQQWKDIMANYDARQRNEGNTTWKDVLVACGYDPSFPITAELFELSRLPEAYDDRVATEMGIYTFALAYRVDPREFWPVSAGPLGTATEASIQHKKAKAKGEGIIFAYIERLLNGPYGISPLCKFRFDYREDEDDKTNGEIIGQRIANVRKMWETSPNDPVGDRMLSTEEARQLLVRWDCVPPDIIGQTIDIDRIYDVRTIKMLGPWARVWNTGLAQLVA